LGGSDYDPPGLAALRALSILPRRLHAAPSRRAGNHQLNDQLTAIVLVQTVVMLGLLRSSRAACTRWHSALCAGQAALKHALPQKRALRQPVQ